LRALLCGGSLQCSSALRRALHALDRDTSCLSAPDVETARRRAARIGELDVVVLDQELVGASAPDVEMLRDAYPSTPLVVVSSHDPAKVAAAFAAGAVAFLPRSSPHATLVGALSLVLAGGVYVPPEE
jgi:DNA-binding NarL/FixJ family response regulator